MTAPFTHVQPGDLITSDLFNQLLDAFNDLNARVIVLEGSASVGDVAILGLVPGTGIVRLGDQLTVVGYGFGLSIGACQAFIDNVQIGQFLAGSNDEQLIFMVPLAVGTAFPVPPTGRAGSLVVRGPRGQAKRDLTILPQQVAPPGGMGMRVAFLDSSPNPIAAGKPATIRFNVTSMVSPAITVTPSVAFSGVANPAPWQATASFTQGDGTALTGGTFALKGGEVNHTIALVLGTVPAGTDGATVNYVVNLTSSDAAPVTGASSVMSFTVGATAPQTNPNISVSLGAALPATALQGSAIVLAPGKAMTLQVLVTFTKAGNYLFDPPAVSTSATGWTATLTSGATSYTAATDSDPPQRVLYSVQTGPTTATGTLTLSFRLNGGTFAPTTVVLQLKPA
jgi:hypothetical protein